MIVLIPLYRFSLEYEVASGQPYSELHSLVLRAIAESEDIMLQVLQEMFGLPSRILIEILVMLFKEGWIAISAKTGGGFCITQQGRDALKFNKRPESRLVESKSITIIMERVTGMLATQTEVDFEAKFRLKERDIWQHAYRLDAQYNSGSFDEGQAQSLLKYNKRQWIRHVGTPILTHDSYYLPVDVDRRPGTPEEEQMGTTGLPGRWREHLEPLLVEVARKRILDNETLAGKSYWTGREPRKTSRQEATDGSWSVQVTPEDSLLFTRAQHVERLKQAFDTAKSVILISSGAINSKLMHRDLSEHIKAARRRQIQIDVLWGRTVESAADRWNAAKFLSTIEKPAGAGLSLIPTNANANLLIYDTDEGYHALVGSFHWLATSWADSGDNETFLTVELRHPGIIADLARSAAAFMLENVDRQLVSSPDRWKRIAESQARCAVEEPVDEDGTQSGFSETCMVRVVRDQQHSSMLSGYVTSAHERVAIISERVDETAFPLMASLINRRHNGAATVPITVCRRGSPTGGPGKFQDLSETVEFSYPGLRANALVSDGAALISSHSFLAQPLSGDRNRTREVGILLEGETIANAVWNMFCHQP